MKEAEAKTKWCPLVRIETNDSASINRGESASIQSGTRCIGTACMAWRWGETYEASRSRNADMATALANKHSENDKRGHDLRDGYCGAFGNPQ